MGISNYALDTFVAQDMSKLTQLSVNSLASEFPSADSWFATFVLRRIFQAHVPDEKAALAFAIIRRTHAALQEWEFASTAAQEIFEVSPRISTYCGMLKRALTQCVRD